MPGQAANVSLESEGVIEVKYYAVDNAGNTETPHSATFKIDKTAPTIALEGRTPTADPEMAGIMAP